MFTIPNLTCGGKIGFDFLVLQVARRERTLVGQEPMHWGVPINSYA